MVYLTLHVRGMGLHVRKGVKDMIFILNPNPTSLSFQESWLFNNST